MEKIRVLLVDDHEMVRMGISNYLMTETGIEVVGEAENGKEGVRLATELQPDVILMDLIMPEMDGIEATRRIREVAPASKVIILTSFMEDKQIFPAIEAGALSYILKTARAYEIVSAIRAAYQDEPILEPKVASKLMGRMRAGITPQPHELLTEREYEVLILIGEARTNQEIADQLFIGIKTVKTHVSNILQKLGLEDRTQAAVYVHKNGLSR